MPVLLSIADIAGAFPKYRVAFVVAEDLTIPPERSAALDALIREREAQARERWAGFELARIPGVAAWREAYKGFGIKQTRYRSSVERLVKNVWPGRELARVNTFVDLYNAVSLAHVLPLGADDLDQVTPPFAFRYARPDDNFVDMADAAGGEDERGAGSAKGGRGRLRRRHQGSLPALELAAGRPLADRAADHAGDRHGASQRGRRRRGCRDRPRRPDRPLLRRAVPDGDPGRGTAGLPISEASPEHCSAACVRPLKRIKISLCVLSTRVAAAEAMSGTEPLSFEQLNAVLRGAAEPTRLRILALLAEMDLTVSDLTEILRQSQPRISRHLKLLAEAGLVERSREGSWAFFRLPQENGSADLARAADRAA